MRGFVFGKQRPEQVRIGDLVHDLPNLLLAVVLGFTLAELLERLLNTVFRPVKDQPNVLGFLHCAPPVDSTVIL